MRVWGIDGTRGWATNLWKMLNDGGIWQVPRSGLVYRKNAAAKQLILVERVPAAEDTPFTQEQLDAAQNEEHEGITRIFSAIGVEVVGDE